MSRPGSAEASGPGESCQHTVDAGYEQWIEPAVATEEGHSSGSSAAQNLEQPTRRGRGRPRVSQPRDESALEARLLGLTLTF